jgi:hypothetical protein
MGKLDSLRDIFENKQKALQQGDQRIQDGKAATKAVVAGRRLSTAQLTAAGCNTSNNPLIQSLWSAVQDYNTQWQPRFRMNNQQVSHSVAILDFIYQACGTYMTDKSMKTLNSAGGTAKRKLRYDAFASLIQELAREIESLGGKMLVGPTDFRTQQQPNYWLERLDPNHRSGFKISDKYDKWVKSGSPLTFWQYLGLPDIGDGNVAGYRTLEGVQWEHCCYFEGDQLWNMETDLGLSTANMSSAFSGRGWGVFVCSMPMAGPDGKIGEYVFSNTHRSGFDHHSSFLGGAPVMAAGEWIVDSTGRIRVMTGKSGHYKPKWENIYRFVSRYHQIPGDAIIRPNMLDHNNGTDTIKYYRVSDFRSQQLRATPLRKSVVLGAIGATGANIIFSEKWPVGKERPFSDLLPP